MPLSKTLVTAVALGAAAVAPSAAAAAEGLTGVTVDGHVVQLQSDSIPSLRHAPQQVTGLGTGEAIVGLDRAPSGELLALTSTGNIASLDAATGKAVAKFPAPVTGPVDPKAALTFAVAPDAATARILTAGRDVTVDLATGKATAGSGLTFAAGDAHAGAQASPALDYQADGRLIGVDAGQRAVAAQTAVGASTLGTAAGLPSEASEPVRSTVASDGVVWATSGLTNNGKSYPQSLLLRYNPATGRLNPASAVLGVKLAALSADGQVADDTTKPRGSIRSTVLHRHVRQGYTYYGPLRVKSNEAGQVTAQLLLRGKTAASGLASRNVAGTFNVQISARKNMNPTLAEAAADQSRAVVRVTVHDWAGNKRTYQRAVHLSR
jgi:Domain of unknown function (DUF4394)